MNQTVQDEGSDSGDSLFLTQKAVAQPLRSTRAPRLTQRSTPISPRLLEAASSSESEQDDVPRHGTKSPRLPRYSFPFLKPRRPQFPDFGQLGAVQNRAIHYYGILGFFKSVNLENEGSSLEPTLPTVDLDNEELTPITDDELSEEEDVKVIDKRLFVYSVKPTNIKTSQPWFKSLRKKLHGCLQKKKSTRPGHLEKKQNSQSTLKKQESLTKTSEKQLDSSDSDMTYIEDHEPSTSKIKSTNTSQKHTCASASSLKEAEIQPSVNQGPDFSASEESDDTESQSILQNNPKDIRKNSQENICRENIHHQSTKKKHKKLEGANGNQATTLSQESLHLCGNLNTNRLKNKSLTKKSKSRSKTKNEEDAEKQRDVIDHLETTLVTEPLPLFTSTQQEVTEQSINEYTGLPFWPSAEDSSDNDVALQKKLEKNSCDVENREKGRNSLNIVDVPDNGQMNTVSAIESEASVISESNRKKHKKKRKADPALEKDQTVLMRGFLNRDRSEILNYAAPDFTATQSDESLSVRNTTSKVSSATEEVAISTRTNKDIDSVDKSSHKIARKADKSKKEITESAKMLRDVETATFTELTSLSSNINEDTLQLSCSNIEVVNNNDATVHKKKKKKHKKKTAELENAGNENNLASDSLQLQGQMNNSATAENEVNDRKRKKQKKKRKTNSGDGDNERDIKMSVTRQSELFDTCSADFSMTQNNASASVRKKKEKVLPVAEAMENTSLLFSQSKQSHGKDELDLSANDVESAGKNHVETMIQKKNKKKSNRTIVDLEKDPNETSSCKFDSSEMLGKEQSESIGKKKKKKRKSEHSTCNDELVNNSAGDFIDTQLGASLSVKKKKKKVPPAPEMEENASFSLSQSKQSHRADKPYVSTKDFESAESDRLLPDAELGNKLKRKKKKKHSKDDELDTNDKASEAADASGFKETTQSDVVLGDCVKENKVKPKHNDHSSDIEKTNEKRTSEFVEISRILSPKSVKRKKKKGRDADVEGVVVAAAEDTEVEQTAVKRKHGKKSRIEDVEQNMNTVSHGEMSTPAGKFEKNSSKKRRLYNPSSETFLEQV